MLLTSFIHLDQPRGEGFDTASTEDINMEIDQTRREAPPQTREYVLRRDGNMCRYCGSRNPPFHLDHVYPFSKGGETTTENLVTACVKCNSRKHNSVGIWPKPVGYFSQSKKPRIDFMNIVLLSTGVGLVGVGTENLVDGFLWIGKLVTVLGFILCSAVLLRLSTGR